MSAISIITTIATVVLSICFTAVWIKKGFKKSILYLVLSIAVMFVAFCFKTEDSELTSRIIIGVPSVFMTIGGIFYAIIMGVDDIKQRMNGLKIIVVSVVLFLILGLFGLNFTWNNRTENKYDDVWDKNPNNWTDDEKEYVNDFFEWQQDYYDNN